MLKKLLPVIGLALVAQTINALQFDSASTRQVSLFRPRFAQGKYYNAGRWDLKPEYALDGIKGSKTGDKFAHSHQSKARGDTFIVGVKNVVTLRDLSYVIIYPRADCCWDRYQTFQVFASVVGKSVKLTPVEDNMTADHVKGLINDGLRWDFTDEDKLAYSDILDERVILIKVSNSGSHLQIAEIEAYYNKGEGSSAHNAVAALPNAANAVLANLHNPRFTNGLYYKKGTWDLKPAYAIDGIKGSKTGTKFAHSARSSGDTFYVDIADNNSVLFRELSHVIIYPRSDCCFERYGSFKVIAQGDRFKSLTLTPVAKMSYNYVKNHIETGLKFDLTADDKYANPSFLDQEVRTILVKNSGAFQQIAEIEVYYAN